jgi:hypothetical protein
LSVDSTSIASPGNFNAIVDASTLSVRQSYSGSITLQCLNGERCVQVPIAVNVTVPTAPLTITTRSLPAGNVGTPLISNTLGKSVTPVTEMRAQSQNRH